MFPTSHDITPGTIDSCLIVLKKLLIAGNQVLVVSKPHLDCVKRLCDELKSWKSQVEFRFTIGSTNDEVLSYWEPGAPNFAERLDCLRYAFEDGWETSVSCEPMLDLNPKAVLNAVSPYITKTIWLGRGNRFGVNVALNNPEEKAVVGQRARELIGSQSNAWISQLYADLHTNPKVRWKDSIKKVMGL